MLYNMLGSRRNDIFQFSSVILHDQGSLKFEYTQSPHPGLTWHEPFCARDNGGFEQRIMALYFLLLL